jgi:fluoroquinolone transport system ATP-binding protein
MVKIEDLIFRYPKSAVDTLKHLNFEIGSGEIFGFLGPSGSGKSTTQKILYKILSNYSGHISIDGKNLKAWDNSYYENIGVGFELPNHYLKLTGAENLDLFMSFYNKKRKKSLEQLFELVDLKNAIHQPVESYSKGMRVRLNFLRAIQHDPAILFFDEPTSGLDPINAQKIKQHILELNRSGKTIFITTHSMEAADQLCNRVAFMEAGELLAIDTPQNFKNKYGKSAVKVTMKAGEVAEFPLDGLGDNMTFAEFIKKGEVNKIHTMEATLEEVFISITGKKLTV